MDGTASAGSSDAYARGDHVHPTDTSRASASDLTAHTGNTTVHVTAAERTAWNAKADTTHATTSTYGLVKPDGRTVAVNGDGALSVPIADTGNVGLVKPDNTSVTIDNDGTLHTQGAAIASSSTPGIVAPDDESFYVDSYDGTMHLNHATDLTLGGVKINEYEAVGMQSDDHSLYVKTDETTITKNEYGQLTVIGGGGGGGGGGSSIDPYDSDPEMD
jgi:flagellar basal body rod protein FlgF